MRGTPSSMYYIFFPEWKPGNKNSRPDLHVCLCDYCSLYDRACKQKFLNVLMEAAPDNINAPRLYEDLQKVIGVVNVHDIHIWCISIGRPSISLHILSDSPQKSLEQATIVCKKYGIQHITIQVEDNTQIKRLSYIKCTHEGDNDIH